MSEQDKRRWKNICDVDEIILNLNILIKLLYYNDYA
jgi:hypothetical protein